MKINEWQMNIFDSLYDGVLIADREFRVVYINPAYTRITNVNYEDIIGKEISEVRLGSKLPEVISSGKKLIGIKRKVSGIEYIVNIVPIIENNDIVGGISILNEINDIYKLVEELRKSNDIIKDLKDKVKNIGNQARYVFDDIVGEDPKTIETKALARKIAKKDLNVLITGESGTGKELIAQAIHNESERRNKPFVAINCATLESNFLESELFGYSEGAFTGAKKGGKRGLFLEASGGTLFLDELSEMDYKLQAKLLRTLQENIIRPIGGVTEIPIDVRIIAATNRNLETMIENNEFRRDLYYRIAIFTVNLLPLRERRKDIIPLSKNFFKRIEKKFRKDLSLNEEVLKLLESFKWSGNVRELKNAIEFAAMMTEDNEIKISDLPKKIQEEGFIHNLIPIKTLEDIIKETEKNEIEKAIKLYGDTVEGKKSAAKALGISLASLYNKIK